jgi:sigma-B regulation protein RsbU (phosphoserine phosphatase)
MDATESAESLQSAELGQLRQRVDELTMLYNITMLLAEARELPKVLDRAVQLVTEAMGVKAASIRLLEKDNDDLVTRAVFNLSDEYLNKGPVRLSRAEIDRLALSSKGFEYVRNMATDPRTLYPGEAAREGIASVLSVGMRYKGRPIGVLRIYTAHQQEFSQLQIDLMKAIASQTAVAIENARLTADAIEAAALEKQIQLASDVQHRMLPQSPPHVRGLDLASVYVPCHTLGGDFFDFIPLPYDNVGLVIADVSGKGVPASLIMASVRAALRAQVDNVFYAYEVMQRINQMLYRDTRPTEFVTMFYGVLDVPNKRLTYCNAGHPPAMLLRDGAVSELDANNLVLGVDPSEQYAQSILHLRPNDTLLMYTDGLADAMNFQKQTFGRQRIIDAFQSSTGSAETIAQNILWTARKFVGMTARNDDVTMMVAKVM